MSTLVLIYVIGSAIAFVLTVYAIFHGMKGDVLVMDLMLMVVAGIVAGFASWMGLFIAFFVAYGDKVVIKRRRD